MAERWKTPGACHPPHIFWHHKSSTPQPSSSVRQTNGKESGTVREDEAFAKTFKQLWTSWYVRVISSPRHDVTSEASFRRQRLTQCFSDLAACRAP
eukprot:202388-Amphidinium_carterae.1